MTQNSGNSIVERYFPSEEGLNKFSALAEWLGKNNIDGSLLDLGARNRVLKKYLSNPAIKYFSSDLDGDHDYRVNLEQPLPFADNSYRVVVALDVLEHLEHIHLAFREMARASSDVIVIGLPNLAVYSKRIRFLNEGHLGTGKYDLLPDHQGDRHRWLTTYPQINQFVEANAKITGYRIVKVFEEIEGGPEALQRMVSGEVTDGRFVDRCVHILRKSR
jgi:hypothetical protein